uniref:Uncharacterized protein n=1 Tax=Anguilla anguilla TaxID=7936 RepID=A0A0E9SST7_ANGAN
MEQICTSVHLVSLKYWLCNIFALCSCTAPLESIQTPSLFPQFVMLQPDSKID